MVPVQHVQSLATELVTCQRGLTLLIGYHVYRDAFVSRHLPGAVVVEVSQVLGNNGIEWRRAVRLLYRVNIGLNVRYGMLAQDLRHVVVLVFSQMQGCPCSIKSLRLKQL